MASLSLVSTPSQGRLSVASSQTRRRLSVVVASLQPSDESRPHAPGTPLPQSAKSKPSSRHSAIGSSNGAVVQSDSSKQTAEALSFFPDLLSSPLVLPDSIDSSRISSVEKAIEAIRRGEMVVVMDPEDRENEGDIIMAASLATAEKMAFIVRHCSGLVCVAAPGTILDRLNIPLMVPPASNHDAMGTAFTVSVDSMDGTTTGISAADRAHTVRSIADPESQPSDFRRPGHVFPLRYREGGVLKRPGHTEAAVDLARAAGLPPVGVLCEIVDPDSSSGTMARGPALREFAAKHGLHVITVQDIIEYRRRKERVVERVAAARMPTQWGDFRIVSYVSLLDGIEHVAMVKGDLGDGEDVLVRLHSECLTGDIFTSQRCDCGPQLHQAMHRINEAGRGVCVYLRGHEGRGIGLGSKLQAYNLQDMGRDTVQANLDLGFAADSRDYTVGAQILRDLGVQSVTLLTNNPVKMDSLRSFGFDVIGRAPVICPINPENKRYLETKRSKMGHFLAQN